MTKHSTRMPCDHCGTTGVEADDEMSSGVKICTECMGHGWLDETPQPVAPKPDIDALDLNPRKPTPPWSLPRE